MSTAGPIDPQPHWPSTSPLAANGPSQFVVTSADSPGIDPALIQQTKNEIRVLVHEITQLAQADIRLDQFYDEFLRRVVSALASHGGAIWTVSESGGLELQYQVNLPRWLVEGEEGRTRHSLLLKNVLASQQPTLVPPQSGSRSDDEAGNPTDFLLVLATLKVEQQTVGVIEIFQRPGGGPTTQRGYLRFLVQMSELAADFLKNRRLRHLGDRQSLWENLERFIRAIHRGLDTGETTYTIVNESRMLIPCDRVSLAIRHGKRYIVKAVSGLDTIDRRGEQIKRLGRLVGVVAAARQPFWYTGQSRDTPPQIEDPLHQYLDQAHAKLLAIIPLSQRKDEAASPRPQRPEPIGALVVEQLADSRLREGLRERVETIAAHSADALANALDHESLFLLPVWRALGRAKWVVRARTLPKTIFALAALLGVILALALIPADFEVGSRGKLQPSLRRDIFAHIDGVVVDVPVRHQQPVEPGQVLAKLTNNSLEVEIVDLIGRKRTIQERIRSVQRAQLNDRHLGIEQQNRLAGQLLELRQVEEGTDRELALLRQKEEQLIVRSEMRGQVVTWNVGDVLMRRPVQKGQVLMTIVEPGGDWELELYMPERRIGHVARAAAEADGLKVTFLLASHPDQQFEGRVVELHRTAEVRGPEGNTVLIRVAINKEELPELRSETSVTARVHCGRRPIGYVLFHELLETVHSKVLFWL